MADDRTPLVKLKLERLDIVERVRSDALLSASNVLGAMGLRQEAVLRAGLPYRFPDRAVLFQPGDDGTSLLLVLSGEVRLYARRDSDLVELSSAKTGEVVGEDEVLLLGVARKNAAVAQGPVEVLELPREALMPGGTLSGPLQSVLQTVQARRRAQRDELSDFMNRW